MRVSRSGVLVKLLVALLLAFGIGGFVLSLAATAYSREKKSISKHFQTMDVIHKVATETAPQNAIHTALEPRPHIRVISSRVAPKEEITEPLSPLRSETSSKSIATQVTSSAEISKAVPQLPDEVLERLDIKKEVGPLPDESVLPLHTSSPKRPVFVEAVIRNAAKLSAFSAFKISSINVNAFKTRGGTKRHVERIASPLFAGSAAIVVVVLAIGYFALFRTSADSTVPKPNATATTLAKKSNGKSVPVPTTIPDYLSPYQSDAAGSFIAAPNGSYTVNLSVSGPCWVAQSSKAGGVISWDAVLQPGQARSITTSGPLWLRTGNSTVVKLTLNGVPIHFSSSPGAYNFTFTPGAGGSV